MLRWTAVVGALILCPIIARAELIDKDYLHLPFPSPPVQLPGPFHMFRDTEVVDAVLPGPRPAVTREEVEAGGLLGTLGEDEGARNARLARALLWPGAEGQVRLAVLIQVWGGDGAPETPLVRSGEKLCLIALLKVQDSALRVDAVADERFHCNGVSSTKIDGRPYRLDSSLLLMGVRETHGGSWTSSTVEYMLLQEGNRLRTVLETPPFAIIPDPNQPDPDQPDPKWGITIKTHPRAGQPADLLLRLVPHGVRGLVPRTLRYRWDGHQLKEIHT